MPAPLVFLNGPKSLFTPAKADALATYIRECALCARADGFAPLILATELPADLESYADFPLHFATFAHLPKGSPRWNLDRLDRKIFGWSHVAQRAYMKQLVAHIRARDLESATFFLNNDPHGTVYLRSVLPRARLIHIFHNHLEAAPRVRRLYARSANMTVAVSQWTRAWAARYYGLADADTRAVHNGVNLEQFRPAATEPNGPPLLNFAGQTAPIKGPDLLLQAALALSARGLQFGVQIIGANYARAGQSDDYQEQLARMCAQLRARGHDAQLLGHVDRARIAELFRRAQIHVVPSRWDEPFGLTTVEGMASGLATVASNTGGSPEIIGEAGLLFGRDDAADLAAKLERLLADENLRRDYARNARARACEFTWSATWRGLKAAAGL